MPCSNNDIALATPSGPSGPIIPGLGNPFAIKTPPLIKPITGMPEDLLTLFNDIQMLIPPGALKSQLSKNYGKDAFDSILKLMDQFYPFLMLYKFFMPVLNMIICIIEVLCSLTNPFKLASSLRRLFRKCIPEFLNIFPIFALIIMIISMILLLLTLIDYIENEIKNLTELILRNITALNNAYNKADQTSILSIAKKLGSLLCGFQNLFVLLSLFTTVIDVIKDILKISSSIPPCDDSNTDGCCTTDVCPAIVKTDYTRTTGNIRYLNQVDILTNASIGGGNFLRQNLRQESVQIYDISQEISQRFIEIIDAHDVTISPKPVFFPVDSTYAAKTVYTQAPYTIDLRLFYSPSAWGRIDFYSVPRYIRFKNCIVTGASTNQLEIFDNTNIQIDNGVLRLAGGLGYEDDGTTVLTGFASDGITAISDQATLENFIHTSTLVETDPNLYSTDGYVFSNIEYTFKPNRNVLQNKNLITLGCEPALALDKAFINTALAGDIGLRTQLLSDLFNGTDATPSSFPNPTAAQECISTALSALRADFTTSGVANFSATTAICLQKLKDDANNSLSSLIGIGFEACKSSFALDPIDQFTTKPITVSVNIKERNGLTLITSLTKDTATNIAAKLKGYPTLGKLSQFTYDGYGIFNALLTSDVAGLGELSISFDNNIFCTNNISNNLDIESTHDLQTLAYQFIHTTSQPPVGEVSNSDGAVTRSNE